MNILRSAILAVLVSVSHLVSAADRPNLVILFTGNMGHGDLQC